MPSDIRWWEDERMPCRGRDEFADTTLVRGPDRGERLRDMAEACRHCPVVVQCAADMLTLREPPRQQVRAGKVWR